MVILVGGWTNPSEKYSSKWVHLPQIGVNIKNIWNHHLVIPWYPSNHRVFFHPTRCSQVVGISSINSKNPVTFSNDDLDVQPPPQHSAYVTLPFSEGDWIHMAKHLRTSVALAISRTQKTPLLNLIQVYSPHPLEGPVILMVFGLLRSLYYILQVFDNNLALDVLRNRGVAPNRCLLFLFKYS